MWRRLSCAFIAAVAWLMVCGEAHAQQMDMIVNGDYLFPGQSIISSPHCSYRLSMQSDGNLVLYDNVANRSIWSTNTANRGGYAMMDLTGIFYVLNWNGGSAWNTGVGSGSTTRLVVQDNGNLVLYDWYSNVLWSSRTSRPSTGGTTACFSRKTKVAVDRDRAGYDYQVLNGLNPRRAASCGYFCAQDSSRCRAWAYSEGENRCWLKNGVSAERFLPGITSGVIRP